MYKYEENTYLFSKNDVIEALKLKFDIVGSLTDLDLGPYNLDADDPDFMIIRTKHEFGDRKKKYAGPRLLEEGSLD